MSDRTFSVATNQSFHIVRLVSGRLFHAHQKFHAPRPPYEWLGWFDVDATPGAGNIGQILAVDCAASFIYVGPEEYYRRYLHTLAVTSGGRLYYTLRTGADAGSWTRFRDMEVPSGGDLGPVVDA